MNFFKRALASVTRRTGKSLILFAVVFILGNVIAGAISIQQATKSVENQIKSKLGGNATLTLDYKALDKLYQENPDLEVENVDVKTIKKIGKLPYVNFFDYSVMDHIGTKKTKMYNPDPESIIYGSSGGISNYFSLKGVNLPEIVDARAQKIEIIKGRAFTQEEVDKSKPVIVVSSKMAETNNVGVGDKLVFDRTETNWVVNSEEDSGGEVDETSDDVNYTQEEVFEIVGLFGLAKKEQETSKKKNDDNDSMQRSLEVDQYNTVYMPNGTLQENRKLFQAGIIKKFAEMEEFYGDESNTQEYYTPFYVLKNPDDSEAFRAEAEALLPEKYNKVLLSIDQYDNVATPVKNMDKMASLVIIIAVAAAVLIITLVVLLFLRDRKHELGVYLSLGEKRSKVIGQIVIEVLLISFVAITLSVFSGNILAKGLSGSLIETQVKADQEKQMNSGGPDNSWELAAITSSQVTGEDITKNYEISLSAGYIIIFYIVGLGTVLVSTVVPLVYILRLNPKKILM